MKKTDMEQIFKKYEPVIKKTGEQLQKAMKSAEKDISKMYKIAQTHVEIQMKNLQKEKLYHKIGKYVSEQILKDKLDVSNLDKYKKELLKVDADREKMKKKLAVVNKQAKKKTIKKNK